MKLLISLHLSPPCPTMPNFLAPMDNQPTPSNSMWNFLCFNFPFSGFSTFLSPTNPCAPFPPNFREVVKTIFKRLFRVYAHIYHSHFQKIVSLKEEAHLNTCFKHFILFTCPQNGYNSTKFLSSTPKRHNFHEECLRVTKFLSSFHSQSNITISITLAPCSEARLLCPTWEMEALHE
ncbi:hypothetical protein GBA52_016526 [Prunus armeniaca]|nr:hypothetical protein GBA52_016526 [Prunus armeniaca]